MLQPAAALLILAASTTAPTTEALEPRRVRLELAAGGLWQNEYDDDYGGLERSGPGVNARATFRLGRHLALASDLAWVRGKDAWTGGAKTTTATLTGTVLWHFGGKAVQPYLGLGAALNWRDYCYAGPSAAEPSRCYSDSGGSPVVLEGGVKFINMRSGLTIAPEVRVEFLVLRLGLNIGWARIK